MTIQSEKEEEADRPYKLAIKFAEIYGGKVGICPRVPVHRLEDFAVWYSPGVAEVSRRIEKQKDLSYRYTNRSNAIAVVTDGTRVLGLGDVGAEASLPVMEGKSLLFKYLGGVDAFPLPISCTDPDQFISVVKSLEPGLGGINLEDIAHPKCFRILETLREEMNIPVWHDDQQGTAAATVAGLLNALELTGRKMSETRMTFMGAGAANLSNARLAIEAGFPPENFIMIDSKGIIHSQREDIERMAVQNPWKHDFALKTNPEGLSGPAQKAFEGADVIISASIPGPGVIAGKWIRKMAEDPIVFALANPTPEIWPWEARKEGAAVVATGRGDFPNQINNSLIFPSVFRGVLDVGARTITDEMAVAASRELASFAREKGISSEYVIPKMTEWEVYPRVASATAQKAMSQGIAERPLPEEELVNRCRQTIARAREQLQALMDREIIIPAPGGKIY